MYRRLVGYGGKGLSVRQLGGGRAGEMRITRFLHNPKVTVGEMMAAALARTSAQVAGRHVLAIQDSSALRIDEKGAGLSFHPVIAVDANGGTGLGLVDNVFLTRRGGERASRKQRDFADKDSRRWLTGAHRAGALAEAGAACVTVVEDREGDIYECFAFKPANVAKLVRAAQDRRLADGTSLFSKAEVWEEAGRTVVELPAIPGRKARCAELSVKFGRVEMMRPESRKRAAGLPNSIVVTLVIGRELNPPEGAEPALWLLLTTHQMRDLADACRIIGFYRLRWIIEAIVPDHEDQGLRCRSPAPAAGWSTGKACHRHSDRRRQGHATRQGARRQSQTSAAHVVDADDQPALERVCQSLEGKTAKQKNPHPPARLPTPAWVFARLGGWTGYYGKPGPIVMLRGLTQFQSIKHGWTLRNV